VRVSKKSYLNIGWPYQPGETIAAQMNGFYAAAVTLVDGDAFIDQYDERRLADPAILALLPRIDFVHDPELDLGGAAKRHAIKMEAVRNDGSVLLTTIEQRRGSADHPLTTTEIERKFRRLAATTLSQPAVEELISIIGALEREANLHRLTSLVATRAC
jgi:2-methylcitrate dehydratase PrpD